MFFMQWALIFDFDGVLVDSEVHWRSVEHDFLSGLVPGWSDSDQEAILGMSAYDVHGLLVEKYGVTLSRSEYVGYYRNLSRTIYGERSALLPGARELIVALSEAHIPLAIATSSPRDWLNIALERFALAPYFRALASSDDVQGVGKPAPDVYLHAAKQLSISPRRCIAIEDTKKGIASAKSAGMVCVALRNGFNHSQDLSQADRVIESLHDTGPHALAKLIS